VQNATKQQIKEHPILFSAPMVRAILEGRKVQTRRVVKNKTALDWLSAEVGFSPLFVAHRENGLCPYGQPGDKNWTVGPIPCDGWYYVRDFIGNESESLVYLRQFEMDGELCITWGRNENDDVEAIEMDGGPTTETIQWKRPGQRLWVRETWAWWHDEEGAYDDGYWYRANQGDNLPNGFPKWRPSIHMPRAASRILLEITGVRVERLQDISEQDAVAEGVQHKCYENAEGSFLLGDPDTEKFLGQSIGDYKTGFKALWQSINGPESWEQNPLVWVVEFKRI
jgi:hypothetical protein